MFTRQDRNMTARHRTLLVLVVVAALLATTLVAIAAAPLGVAGYLNHSYAPPPDNTVSEPTGKGAESKLWWHDGIWWGVLFSPTEGAFTIHQLDMATNDWVDTEVLVDDRITGRAARADVLWDEAAGKLYIATHRKQDNASRVNTSTNWARLMVYSYDDATTSWTLDSGYPVLINQDITETLVLDKDSTGRLWITYVSRLGGSDTRNVYVNASEPNDPLTWGIPFVLPFPEATVAQDDISSLIAFADSGGPKVGVMWSNQLAGHNSFYMAVRPDSNSAGVDEGWALEPALNAAVPYRADDHIKLARAPGGVVLAAVKTGETTAGNPLVGVIKRAADAAYSWHTVANYTTQDTRPTLLVDTGSNQVHVFTVSKEGGGNVCIQSADLDTVEFSPFTYNCPPPPPPAAEREVLGPDAINAITPEIFIGDTTTYVTINDPTTTKQMATAAMGIVVLASDNVEQVYVHNAVVSGEPGPPVYGVALSADQAQEGLVGSTVVYNLSVTNTGNGADSFALTVNSSWPAVVSQTSIDNLPPGTSADFQVSVTIPGGTAHGATNITTVTATSDGDNSVTDTAQLTTTASTQVAYGVELAANPTAQSGSVGTTVDYAVAITNIGNGPDTFSLTLAGDTWPTTVAPTSVSLNPGESAQLTVSVQIPLDALHGANNTVTVTATSEGDPETSDSLELTTTAIVEAEDDFVIFMPIIAK